MCRRSKSHPLNPLSAAACFAALTAATKPWTRHARRSRVLGASLQLVGPTTNRPARPQLGPGYAAPTRTSSAPTTWTRSRPNLEKDHPTGGPSNSARGWRAARPRRATRLARRLAEGDPAARGGGRLAAPRVSHMPTSGRRLLRPRTSRPSSSVRPPWGPADRRWRAGRQRLVLK